MAAPALTLISLHSSPCFGAPDQPSEAAETQEPGAERDVQRAAILRVPGRAQFPAEPAPHHPPDQTRLQHPAQ